MIANKYLFLVLISTSSLLSSCAITELALVTGVSYLVTGKSVADNALSMATNMDCKTHNLLNRQPICLNNQKQVSLVESAISLQSMSEQAPSAPTYSTATSYELDNSKFKRLKPITVNRTALPLEPSLVDVASTTTEENKSTNNEPLNNTQYRSMKEMDKPALFAVVGSFKDLWHAEYRQYLYQHQNAKITDHTTASGTAYRVIVGPLESASDIQNIPARKDTELFDPWVIKLCQNDLSLPPCESSYLVKR